MLYKVVVYSLPEVPVKLGFVIPSGLSRETGVRLRTQSWKAWVLQNQVVCDNRGGEGRGPRSK
jgi:hypothetical protein